MLIKNIFKNTLMLAILFSSSVVFAQQMQQRTPEQKAERQTRWMEKNLAITPEQSKKVYNIILNAAQEQQNANMAQGAEKKQEKKAIKRDTAAELQQVLSPDQYQRYVAHLQEMKQKAKERRSGAMQEAY